MSGKSWNLRLVAALLPLLSATGICQGLHHALQQASSGEEISSWDNSMIRRIPVPIEENGYQVMRTRVLDHRASLDRWSESVRSSDDDFWVRPTLKQELLQAVKKEEINSDAFNLVMFAFSEGSPRRISTSDEPNVNRWNRTASVWIDRGDDGGGACVVSYHAIFYVVNKLIEKVYFDAYYDDCRCVLRIVVSNARPTMPPLGILLHEHKEASLWNYSGELKTDLLFRRIPSPEEDAGYKELQTAILHDRKSFDRWKKDVIQSPEHPPLQLEEVLDCLDAEQALDFEGFNVIIYAFDLEARLRIAMDPPEIDKSDRSATVSFDHVEPAATKRASMETAEKREGHQETLLHYALIFQVHKSVQKLHIFNAEQALVILNRPGGMLAAAEEL